MKFAKFSAVAAACGLALNVFAAPLSIEKQGSFAVGGTVKTSDGIYTPVPAEIAEKSGGSFWDAYGAAVKHGGMTLHGDHASVFYQIPTNAKQKRRWCSCTDTDNPPAAG